jgi:hypothetical protein
MSCSEGHWHTCAEMVLNIDIITVMIAIIGDNLSPMADDTACNYVLLRYNNAWQATHFKTDFWFFSLL